MSDFKQESRKNWIASPAGRALTNEEVLVGTSQRMADALERVATATELSTANVVKLQNEVAMWKRQYEAQYETSEKLRGTIRNMKGQITKLKRKEAPNA